MERQDHVQDWIEYIVDNVCKYYCGRKIVLWGKYIESDNIRNRLKEKYHIDTAFYVDGDSEKIDNKEVFSTECLSGRSAEYYVVIPLAVYQSIRDILLNGGYKADTDYFYFSDCVLREEKDYYEDSHGNKIIGNRQGIKFAFSGFNSVIEIGDHAKFRKPNIYVHNNVRIRIGDNAAIEETNVCGYDNSQIVIGDNAELIKVDLYIGSHTDIVLSDNNYLNNSSIHLADDVECKIGCGCRIQYFSMSMGVKTQISIGEKVEFRGSHENRSHWSMSEQAKLEIGDIGFFKHGNLHLYENSLLRIGREFTIEGNYAICADKDTVISIGDDCMFSHDLLIRSNDGHSIFDITTGTNLNSSYDIRRSRKIIVGNHVWVGMKTVILYDARIKDGSVIGAMSMVKYEIPNNCMAAGIPARVIRRNIAWSREAATEDILTCGQEYINLTKEIKE